MYGTDQEQGRLKEVQKDGSLLEVQRIENEPMLMMVIIMMMILMVSWVWWK